MSKDMKLIMERWDSFVIEEQNEIETVGALKKLIRIHRAKEAGMEVGKVAAESIIEQIPVVSNIFAAWKGIKGAKEAIGKIYGSDDKIKTQTGLDKLDVDDNISKIVDDPIEVAFLNDLLATIENMDDDAEIPDVNVELQKFLAAEFEGYQVKK
jgi:hypothetical protein